MKRKAGKWVSILLAAVLILTGALPAAAQESETDSVSVQGAVQEAEAVEETQETAVAEPGEAAEEEVTAEPSAGFEDSGETETELSGEFDAGEPDEAEAEEKLLQEEEEKPSVSYYTHVQTYGWQDPVSDGSKAGTEGESKRLEGIVINVDGVEGLGISYRVHVQTYGWQDYVEGGQVAGTEGKSKRLEAIQIVLTGEAADRYDVWYQTHIQHFGWSGWASNGEACGSEGYSYRLEGIRILVQKKGDAAPGDTASVFYKKGMSPEDGASTYANAMVRYNTHVQTYGWQSWKCDGALAGTSGESKRLESVRMALGGAAGSGGIRYRTHVQTYGWQDWARDGEISGTTGQSKRLEAIQIELTGDIAETHDVYYRVHVQTSGWLPWARNGQQTGTTGMSRRLEALEVVVLPKDQPMSEYSADAEVLLVNTVKYNIFLGDSRTCCIVNAVHGTALWRNGATANRWFGNDYFACKWGGHLTEGNNYFVKSVLNAMRDDTNVFVLMGRNDIGIPQTQYAGTYNSVLAQLAAEAAKKKNTKVFFVTCGPDQGHPVTQFAQFNNAVGCAGVQKLDPWTRLGTLTYTTKVFGDFHYSDKTSKDLYNWLKQQGMR